MRRGFTIVELIIGCLIIGVIAAVGMNAYINLRDDAISRTAAARLYQLNVAKEQFTAEYGRLEAQNMWSSPPNNLIAGQTNSDDEKRYNLLKRYIERPQATLAEFMPAGCTVITPASVYNSYTGTDNKNKTLTPAP